MKGKIFLPICCVALTQVACTGGTKKKTGNETKHYLYSG